MDKETSQLNTGECIKMVDNKERQLMYSSDFEQQ